MDVINLTEENFRVTIVFCVFESTLFHLIGLGVQIWSCIVNDNPGVVNNRFSSIGCFSYILNHSLVLSRSFSEQAVHALRTSPDRTAISLIIVT